MGEQSSSVFARAPVTVRSAFHGNVEDRGEGDREGGGGKEEGQKRRRRALSDIC